MNNRIKKAALTGISTLMIFSASVLPSFAADNHHKSDYPSGKKLVVQTVTENPDGSFLSRTVTYPLKGKHLKGDLPHQKNFQGKLTAEQRKEMKDKWEQKMKKLTPEQRKAIMDKFKADRQRD